MADTPWHLKGEYFETCNCDFLCPCPTSHLQAPPTEGDCKAAMAFHVQDGKFGDLSLDGLTLVLVIYTPGAMIAGDWTLGIILDDTADEAQRAAIETIVSGKAGGPLERLSALVGTFAGIESAPIEFKMDGLSRSLKAGDLVDQAIDAVTGARDPDEPMYLDNLAHPGGSKLGLAKASHSHIHAFGIELDLAGAGNNGHLAPFAWQGAAAA